jgi:hypothetical protein
MTRYIFLICPLLLVAVAIASGCSRQPTIEDAEFGSAVRNVMEYQIHDYEAALHPEPNAIEGSDADRLNAVVDAYRGDAGEAQEAPPPVTINLGQ